MQKADIRVSVTSANAVYPLKGPVAPSGVVVSMPNNRPTICTADGQNCVAMTSRLHFDAGGYDYRPNTPATTPQHLDDGVNGRRARIGVIGKFMGDWDYALVYDCAGSSGGFADTGSAGGTSVGFLPGVGLSGIETPISATLVSRPLVANLPSKVAIWTLDEAMSSNDILFMERSSAQVIATNIAAGDSRSTDGTRWYNDRFWAGAYATGPTPGAIHSASSVNPNSTTEQFGAVARATGQVVSGPDYSLHIGADAEFLIAPAHNGAPGLSNLIADVILKSTLRLHHPMLESAS